MIKLLKEICALLLLVPLLVFAQAPARQDPAAVRAAAEQYLQQQAAGLPGKVAITIGALDPRDIPAVLEATCAAIEPLL